MRVLKYFFLNLGEGNQILLSVKMKNVPPVVLRLSLYGSHLRFFRKQYLHSIKGFFVTKHHTALSKAFSFGHEYNFLICKEVT